MKIYVFAGLMAIILLAVTQAQIEHNSTACNKTSHIRERDEIFDRRGPPRHGGREDFGGGERRDSRSGRPRPNFGGGGGPDSSDGPGRHRPRFENGGRD